MTKQYKKIIRKATSQMLHLLVSMSPDFVSVALGKLGYTNLIKRSKNIKFQAKVYRSHFLINVRGDYAVELCATQKYTDPVDPWVGLSKFRLNNKTAIDVGANVGTVSIGLVSLVAPDLFLSY